MANSSWINKIIYQKGEEGNEIKTPFPLGTTFDKVYDTTNKGFSLQQLANNLKNFFNRPGFMIYSTVTPNNNSNIVEFYKVSGETDSRFQNKQ